MKRKGRNNKKERENGAKKYTEIGSSEEQILTRLVELG